MVSIENNAKEYVLVLTLVNKDLRLKNFRSLKVNSLAPTE